MRYIDLVRANARRFTGDETVMWASIEQVDELLDDVKEAHPERYQRFMRKAHELMYGSHFDEAYAKWEVEKMSHVGADGKEYKGEHWSMEQTNAALSKWRDRVPTGTNEYDFYVALNAQWHDYYCWAKSRFSTAEEIDTAIIEGAIAFYFRDSDWPTATKVWEYFATKNAATEHK